MGSCHWKEVVSTTQQDRDTVSDYLEQQIYFFGVQNHKSI